MRRFAFALFLVAFTSSCGGGGGDELEALVVDRDTLLTADHRGPISIIADSLVLDCAGHLVSGNGAGIGIEVNGRRSIAVENCRVEDFMDGISVADSELCLFQANVITGNSRDGVVIDSSFLIEFRDTVSTENGDDGFAVSAGGSNRFFFGNEATRNAGSGFEITESTGNLFDGNTVSENDQHGFDLNQSNDNVFTSQVVNDNGDTGFFIPFGSEINRIRDSEACGNAVTDARQDRTVNAFCGNTFCEFEGIFEPSRPCE